MENNLTSIPKERPQEINEILNSLKRYDISIIKELENYVFKQIKENFQDLNSNLALLQLYSLSDEDIYEFEDDSEETKETNTNNNNTTEDGDDDEDDDDEDDDYDYKIRTDISIKILIKGLINFNYNDFELYLNLLPSYVLNEIKETKDSKDSKDSDKKDQKKLKSIDEFNFNVLNLIEVYKELINCKFENFWLIFNDKESIFNKILSTYYYTAITESTTNSSESINNNTDLILKFEILKSISKLLKHSTISINLNQLLKIFNGLESKDKTIEFIKNELNWEINDKNIVLINDSTSDINENDNSNTNSTNSENIKLEQLSRILKKIVEF
ncbi:unnamed protein product [[Candida] boidinii]|uniref:Unnamed protein product n=1 Tax=Candida boidinii TaxID=5477 RepID=A0A9W6WJQ0_CANBO|nr:hypothetical protein B5S30_g5263 [[Candida] boidinii]GME78255.1 unnamed protein product [[Candida] boidinii]GMG18812.1 unnamed protein product [[Candida] boidinii]